MTQTDSAREGKGSEDSAALRSDGSNDWEKSDDHESDANGCESTCRADAEESELGRTGQIH